ncbi:hypothetical protein PTW37_11570 [Arthrobacter agilis]|uniref:hypothetical protein n=1 Tax=Arthrobacter agilis TaxID=37921 RepID=UPI0023653868|nr:hypothetical protein [Arthrobacter agilis]WDF32497.1 hypothetical protein PTW37_11570 [Arthrobacter agilis]
MTHDDGGSSPAGEGRRSAFAPPAGSGRAGHGPAAPRRPVAVLAAVAAGVVAAVFGTVLHGQLLYVRGTALPVGALGALVLSASLFLLCGLWARNVMLSAVAGAVAYGVVAMLSTSSKTLILTGTSEVSPGTALAGNLWLFGVLVVTLAAVVGGAVLLRPRRARI